MVFLLHTSRWMIHRIGAMSIVMQLIISAAISGVSLAAASNQPLAQNQILVTSRWTSSVLRYDASTGEFIDTFVASQSGGLNGPSDLLIAPDGNLLVTSIETHQVLRYDGRTGGFLGVFASGGGMRRPHGMALGSDGNLYVAGFQSSRIHRFDGLTGEYLDTLQDGVQSPIGLLFGPDGYLYATSFTSHSIRRFDPLTGKSTGDFVGYGSGGLYKPIDLVFGPDGDLYVSHREGDSVLRYNGVTGAFKGAFIPTGSGGLDSPEGVVFGPDGFLYVCSLGNDSVLRFDGTTGEFHDVFISSGSGGLDAPSMLVFTTKSILNLTLTARIEPPAPFTTDDLQCVTEIENTGGHAGLTSTFRWFRNGEELLDGMTVGADFYTVTGPELSHLFTAKNETFYCSVMVTDGTGSVIAKTDPVTIRNSPPTAPVVEIRPANPMPGQDLGINILVYSVDPDGDEVDYRIDWFESEDGGITWVEKKELRDHAFISGIYLQEGDLWRVVVTPFEIPGANSKAGAALVEGEGGWDQVYAGVNSRPVVVVKSPDANDTVAAPGAAIKWAASDADGDPVRVDLYYDSDAIKGGAVLIASDLPASGSLNWTPPGVLAGSAYSDLSGDGEVNYRDLFLLTDQWQDPATGKSYRIFARAWDTKNAYGEAFSDGEVLAPKTFASDTAGLKALAAEWHGNEE